MLNFIVIKLTIQSDLYLGLSQLSPRMRMMPRRLPQLEFQLAGKIKAARLGKSSPRQPRPAGSGAEMMEPQVGLGKGLVRVV